MKQHTTPCPECPWRRKAPPGWLGAKLPPEDWVAAAHSDVRIPCHLDLNKQCAGAAIFRDNVCKLPRDPAVIVLPSDTVKVFATGNEFIAHHRSQGPTSPELMAAQKLRLARKQKGKK